VTGGQRFRDALTRLPRTRSALAFAEQRHAGQRRRFDGSPFIEHPIEVASLLLDAGAPDDVIAAGLLHDTLEKTATDAGELRRRFGPRVTALVAAVSEDEQVKGYATRKAALRRQVAAAGRDALMVFAADKISKARELSTRVPATEQAHEPANTVSRTRERRIRHYHHCLELVERLLVDSPLVAQLRAELERLGSATPRRPALANAS
jgi:(p)ppGpp synthase/HD superfamily hydrolase